MNKWITTLIVIFSISGVLRYLNENYDDIDAGIGQQVADNKQARDARYEEEAKSNLAMIVDPEHLLVAASVSAQGIDLGLKTEAQQTVDVFFEKAISGGKDWAGASARVEAIQGFDVWVTDLKEEEPEFAVAGINNATFSGRIIRAKSTSSSLPAPIGQRVTFRQTAVWDWAITRNAKVYGLFTVRRNIDQLPPEVVAIAAENLSDEAVPLGW